MARLISLPSQAIIDGYKGTIDFYMHRGIPCARAWPKSPGGARSEAVMAQWPVFTLATQLWHELDDSVRDAYNAMATGTNLTGRDLFMKGYIAGVFSWYTAPDDVALEDS